MSLRALFANDDLLRSPERVRGILGDFYLGDKAKVNVMMAAYQAGIVTFIRSHPRFDQLAKGSFVNQLVDKYALIEERAIWAVDEWAFALLPEEILEEYTSKEKKIENKNFVYEGEVKNNVADGKGRCVYSDGREYIGEWKEGKMHGEGILSWPNGARYEGSFENDRRNGKGTAIQADGAKYIGEWKDDKRHGYGVYTWPSGVKYEGAFLNDQRHGQGTQTEPNGEQYVGAWVADKKHGKGIYTWPSGARYEGSFSHGKRTGKGTHQYADGNIYDGDWKNDKCHGKGVFVWSNGEKYEGEFFEGLRHGHGTQYYADGWTYIGGWGKGKRRGKSILVSPDGEKHNSEWENDICRNNEAILKKTNKKNRTAKIKSNRYRRTVDDVFTNVVLTIAIAAACVSIIYCFWGAEVSGDNLLRLFQKSFEQFPRFSRLFTQIEHVSAMSFSRMTPLFSGFFSENIGGVIEDIQNLFMQ